jgi:hypothetical protein
VLGNKTGLKINFYKGPSTSIHKIKKNSKTEYNLFHCSHVSSTEYLENSLRNCLHSDQISSTIATQCFSKILHYKSLKPSLPTKGGELIHNNLLSLICENFSRIKNYATCETRINEEFNLISCPVIMKKGCTYVIKTCKPIQYIQIAILFMEGRKIYFPWKSNF